MLEMILLSLPVFLLSPRCGRRDEVRQAARGVCGAVIGRSAPIGSPMGTTLQSFRPKNPPQHSDHQADTPKKSEHHHEGVK